MPIKLQTGSLKFRAPRVTPRKRKAGLERITVLTRACVRLNLGALSVRVPYGATSRRTFYRRPSQAWTDANGNGIDDTHIFDLSDSQ